MTFHFNVARKITQQVCDGGARARRRPRFAGSIDVAVVHAPVEATPRPDPAPSNRREPVIDAVRFVNPRSTIFLSTKPVDKNVDSLYKTTLSHGSE
jgi:hypothetical protein